MSEDLTATSAYYSGRPVLRVADTVEPGLSNGLMTLLVHETTAGLYRCEACIGNWGSGPEGIGYLYFDRDLLEFGKDFSVEAGDADTQGILFKGRIMGLEGRFPLRRPPEILVLCEDRLQDLRMTRRTRTFGDTTDADVMAQVARDHGLEPEIDVDGPSHRVLAQLNQSDLAFLRERARAIDAEVWLADGTLHVQSRASRRAGEVTITYGRRLREFSVLADLSGQCTSFAVGGWDVFAKSGIEQTAEPGAIAGELAPGDTSGADVLRRALGARRQSVVHTMPVDDDEARYAAESRFRTAVRRFVTGTGVAEGDARITVGTKLTLEGLGRLFDGPYDVVETKHSFDPVNGLRTQFRVERPGIGA